MREVRVLRERHQSRERRRKREIMLRSKNMLPFKGTLDFMASRLGPGGKNQFMDLIRLAVELEPALEPIAQAWEDTPLRQRMEISIDELCETAAPGVGTARIFGLVAQAAMSWGLNAGNMVAGLNHERIVAVPVKRALQLQGIQDRKLQFLHSSFIPRGGAPVFNVSASANSESEAQAASSARVDSVGLPPFELETVERAEVIRQIDGDNCPNCGKPVGPKPA